MVMVVMTMVMMSGRGESRTCQHQHQKGSSKNLLHANECSTLMVVERAFGHRLESRQEINRAGCSRAPSGVN